MENISIPYENTSLDVKDYLTEIIDHHITATPYWRNKEGLLKTAKITGNNFEEIIECLLSLEVDQKVLRTNWIDFKPSGTTDIKCSFSSGTTGPQKYCMWGNNYIQTMSKYLHFYISRRNIEVKNAVIQGPSSVYKDVNELMVNRFGGIPYFVGLRVEGIKPVLDDALKRGESNIIKIIRDYFSPEVEKTNRFMDYDQSINTIRSAWMMLAHFDLFYGENRHIDTVIVSGVGYTPQNHELLLNKFKNVIHSYGYFAFGDALGIPFSGNLDYYPAFPYTIFTVIDDKGKVVDYGKEGHPVFIVARKDLLLVLKEENEFAIRISPTDSFNWDGIRNPRRVI